VKNRRTGQLLTDEEIPSISGQLTDANDEEVGDEIAFLYTDPGEWYAVWQREMKLNSFYTLTIVLVGTGLNLTMKISLPARYKGASNE